ncbi:hypothetical protein [Polaromonas sp.]|jgi:hypothetical protein|uniref:hypothetical protein n=1 Tax=Polaromonas sp. TaxID=1869339 RepID=UPI001E0576F8|nr:hypothetical protein [Polaromonas sp.]MBT9476313.1 hypothetical protein [Polaromonas sp.]
MEKLTRSPPRLAVGLGAEPLNSRRSQKKAALRQLSESPPEFMNFVEEPPGWFFNVSIFSPQASIVVTATNVMSRKAGALTIPQVEEIGGFFEGNRRAP